MGPFILLAITFLICGADSLEKEGFKFNWIVENYPYCRQKKCEPLSSPVFKVGESAWHLRLDSRLEADGNSYFGLFLVREIEDRGPDSIEVELEASIFNKQPLSPPRKAQGSITHSFRKGTGYGWKKFINRQEIWSQEADKTFTPMSLLIVNSTLKVSKVLFPSSQEILAITRNDISVQLFTWIVERFSALLTNEIKTVLVKPPSPDGPTMSLALFATDTVPSEVKVQIRVIQHNKHVKCFACQVSVVDASGKQWISFNETFVGNTIGEFSLLQTRDKLTTERDVYLPKDELSLNFHCVVSTGIEKAKILAWKPGVFRSA